MVWFRSNCPINSGGSLIDDGEDYLTLYKEINQWVKDNPEKTLEETISNFGE